MCAPRADGATGRATFQAAEVRQAGLDRRPRDVETDRAVGVLQVRGDRPRAEVRPATDHAVSDEPVVRLVGIAEEETARELPAHFAVRADCRRTDRSAE